ncbi:hypothetical protein HELRODRAFT_101724 [Helobdella robusta]|uniref:fumarate reductase (NADH) n=1 Tax=Helobdella robusta TaxID=6412 RepID=T1ED64_HELRO|nr:hypothetical protein HELRODRAFT_101724 [Helobdella robusta]ESN98547.1 hypothetical protein HELRODRAFT_101724 [Helobdella robusta]
MAGYLFISILLATFWLTIKMSNSEVIVVGGGLAGLSAAVKAGLQGAHVTIIEKEKSVGGNSAKATSGINGAETDTQKRLGIHDQWTLFEQDTIKSGDGFSDPELVKILTSKSKDAIEHLKNLTADLNDVVQLGGHSVARSHRFLPSADGKPVPVGFTLVSTLRKYIETKLNSTVTILTQSKFLSLIYRGNSVVGVMYLAPDNSEKSIYGTVVLSAGGFAHDRSDDSLLIKYAPKLAKLPTTNGVWATGDVIKVALNDNLSLIQLDKIQVHPTGFIDPKDPKSNSKFLAPESLRGCGGLLLNSHGNRFVDELTRRDYVTDAIFKNCQRFTQETGDVMDESSPTYAVLLLNEAILERFGKGTAGFYKFKGLIQDVGSFENLVKTLKLQNESDLRRTLESYKLSAQNQRKDEFGKTIFPVIFDTDSDHFYIAYVTPSLHYCMGGLKIDAQARVYRKASHEGAAETVVSGLFAAGEVTGGVHGQNRLGGNSLLECVVFGRIAGSEAAKYVQVPYEEL